MKLYVKTFNPIYFGCAWFGLHITHKLRFATSKKDIPQNATIMAYCIHQFYTYLQL